MYTSEINIILEDLIFKFHNESIKDSTHVFIHDGTVYILSLILAGKTDLSTCLLENSHEKYIIHQFEKFIEDSLNKENSKIEFIVNYNNDDESYKIYLFMSKIEKKDIMVISDEAYKLLEKSEMQKMEKQLLRLISFYPDGISLTDIISQTRKIKDPTKRVEILDRMVKETKIMLDIDTSLGRKKRIYRPL
jgi:hypothetical protein